MFFVSLFAYVCRFVIGLCYKQLFFLVQEFKKNCRGKKKGIFLQTYFYIYFDVSCLCGLTMKTKS